MKRLLLLVVLLSVVHINAVKRVREFEPDFPLSKKNLTIDAQVNALKEDLDGLWQEFAEEAILEQYHTAEVISLTNSKQKLENDIRQGIIESNDYYMQLLENYSQDIIYFNSMIGQSRQRIELLQGIINNIHRHARDFLGVEL